MSIDLDWVDSTCTLCEHSLCVRARKQLITSNKMPFHAVRRCRTQSWKCDATLRRIYLYIVKNLKKACTHRFFIFILKKILNQQAKTDIWNLRHPSNIASDRLRPRGTAFYYWLSVACAHSRTHSECSQCVHVSNLGVPPRRACAWNGYILRGYINRGKI